MTDQDIAQLGPAFAAFLRRFRPCFLQERTAAHFDNYPRGLPPALPRKGAEPTPPPCATAVPPPQDSPPTAVWHHGDARDRLQRHFADVLADLPADPLGT